MILLYTFLKNEPTNQPTNQPINTTNQHNTNEKLFTGHETGKFLAESKEAHENAIYLALAMLAEIFPNMTPKEITIERIFREHNVWREQLRIFYNALWNHLKEESFKKSAEELIAWIKKHKDKYKNHPEVMIEAMLNSSLNDEKRILFATKTLKKLKLIWEEELSEEQKKWLIDAHNSTGTIFCLTEEELNTKAEILTKSWRNRRQAKILIHYWYAWELFEDIKRFFWTIKLGNVVEKELAHAEWGKKPFFHHLNNINSISILISSLFILLDQETWKSDTIQIILLLGLLATIHNIYKKHKTWDIMLKTAENKFGNKIDPRKMKIYIKNDKKDNDND